MRWGYLWVYDRPFSYGTTYNYVHGLGALRFMLVMLSSLIGLLWFIFPYFCSVFAGSLVIAPVQWRNPEAYVYDQLY